MRTKAFTLIELLAVIVILAIIALIATPIILNIIDNAKEGANRASINSVVRSANNYYYQSKLNKENSNEFNGTLNLLNKLQLENAPDKGAVYIDNEGNVALAIVYDKVCYTKYFDTDIYESNDIANCGVNNEFTTPSSYVNFGGEYTEEFRNIIETSDGGYLAIGYSNSTKYRHGEDVNYDGIIVKYNSKGQVEWSNNFGGTDNEYFHSVIEDGDYYIVTGESFSTDGDLEEYTGTGCFYILKYNKSGKLVNKEILYTGVDNSGNTSIIKYEDYYYVSLIGRKISTGYSILNISKYDEDFNQIWLNQYNDRYSSTSYSEIKLTSNNTLIVAGTAMKNAGEVINIHIENSEKYTTFFEISPEDGSIIGSASIGGNNYTYPQEIAEVEDGYIIVGHTTSNTNHFLNTNKGLEDAYIAKISKTTVDGIFPVEWVKTLSGTQDERYNSVVSAGDEIIVAGYSDSSDYDMSGISISDEGYSNAIIAKYDLNGNLIKIKSFGGSNTDKFRKMIKSGNNYIAIGQSYSTDKDMFKYNYGQSDAIMMKVNNNLDLVYDLNITPILMSAVPELIANYGESIPQPEDRDNLKLYTTNDPTKDLKKWCTSLSILDPNSNYNYVNCLQPFNQAERKLLHKDAIGLENTITLATVPNLWIRVEFYFGNAGNEHQISNLKVKFEGNEAVSIQQAVELGYIEPLVISGKLSSGNYYFSNSFNVLNGGESGTGNYPSLYILIKPKSIKLEQIIFTSDKEVTKMIQGYFQVHQFHNFDISLTPSTK